MAGGGPSQFPEAYAARLKLDQKSMAYYAVSLAGLMGIFIVFQLIRVFAQKTGLSHRLPSVASPFVRVSRSFRHTLVRKVPFLPSAGHAWLAIVYIGINVLFMFTPLVNHPAMTLRSNIASRTGWLSLANIILAIFLGLKNTPLGYLTTWSYERLNFIHQIVGYTALVMTIIHGAAYAAYFLDMGLAARLRVNEEIYGIVAGFTMLTLVVVGFTIRRRCYELFYIIHVSFFILTMVFIGLHQPETHKKIFQATIVGAAIWAMDRLIRIARVALFSLNNRATLYPLPHGGTRIVLKKAPLGSRSGEHCFLWVPSVRYLEMHPFTIAASNPLEFVVAAYDGFTRDLHSYAQCNPGTSLAASVEGSYGSFPNPASYDKVVMVAGGSGASFTVGMALNMLRQMKPESQQSIVFVWIVKDYDNLEWFYAHLGTIRRALNSDVRLYVTRPPSPMAQLHRPRATTTSSTESNATTIQRDPEKSVPVHETTAKWPGQIQTRTRHFPNPKPGCDPEDASPTSSNDATPVSSRDQSDLMGHIHGIPIHYSRPQVSRIIRETVDATPAEQRVLVMGCGPDGLMAEVRNTTADCIKVKGPAVELHCEQFGW